MMHRLSEFSIQSGELAFMRHAHIARRVLEIGKWLALGGSLPVPVSLHPREGARAVPVANGRYVPVTVGGVIYQIYSEAAGTGQDVLCMHTAGADTTRLVSAGSSRACAAVTIGRQDRDEPATNILAANQLGRC
jgi:hypothetical protein